ncbi:hypothetical protein GCM10022236_17790 [Microlunatus ginsengisoli]|uniref:Uncharacterized protein n=1 Tax=Microlunatus ginsengisoli TaxID=363863 RepID=A0ABP6ZTH9_9ACTN
MPRLVIISQTNRPAGRAAVPCSALSRHSWRYAALVIPAIGASTTGVPTSIGPIRNPTRELSGSELAMAR